MRYQRTIKREIDIKGIGLHFGREVNVKILPAPVNTGVVFIRRDIEPPCYIKACVKNVVSTDLCTTLGDNRVIIHTIEHLMAAIRGLEIDNIYIELDSIELPIMDGSAIPFTSLLLKAGIVEQAKIQPYIKIKKEIKVRDGSKKVIIRPSSINKIRYTINFDHHIVSNQSISYYCSEKGFAMDIAKARTFTFLRDIKGIRAKGMAQGGSLDNAIVIGNKEILNNDGLRYEDEFVRHKVLDLIGDLSLLGMPLLGEVIGYCSGHSLNIRLVSKILEDRKSWVLEAVSDQRSFSKEKDYNLSLSPAFS